MKLHTKYYILIPLVLAFVSFVLTILAIFAGRQQGFMEDYAVIRVNTSMVGHNLASTNKDKSESGDEKKGGGLLGDIQGWVGDKKDGVKDKINEATGHVADKLAKSIGLSEWYSLHVMDSCEGMYAPNAAASSPGLNVTNCTSSSPDQRLNLTKLLDHELEVGPLKLSLNDIKWPDAIQDAINTINEALLSLFAIFNIGAGANGLSVLLNAFALWKPELKRVPLVNFVVAALGFFATLLGSMIVTISSKKVASKLNDKGRKVGLSAQSGTKFYVITWIATCFMALVTLFWLCCFLKTRRAAKRSGTNRSARQTKAGGSEKQAKSGTVNVVAPGHVGGGDGGGCGGGNGGGGGGGCGGG